MKTNFKKVSISLPAEVLGEVDQLSRAAFCTRSKFFLHAALLKLAQKKSKKSKRLGLA